MSCKKSPWLSLEYKFGQIGRGVLKTICTPGRDRMSCSGLVICYQSVPNCAWLPGNLKSIEAYWGKKYSLCSLKIFSRTVEVTRLLLVLVRMKKKKKLVNNLCLESFWDLLCCVWVVKNGKVHRNACLACTWLAVLSRWNHATHHI